MIYCNQFCGFAFLMVLSFCIIFSARINNIMAPLSRLEPKNADCLAVQNLNSSMKCEAGKGSYIQRINKLYQVPDDLTRAYETHETYLKITHQQGYQPRGVMLKKYLDKCPHKPRQHAASRLTGPTGLL